MGFWLSLKYDMKQPWNGRAAAIKDSAHHKVGENTRI